MLRVFRELEVSGVELIVTDDRRPVIRITPLRKRRRPDDVFAPYRGTDRYCGVILKPTTDEWPET